MSYNKISLEHSMVIVLSEVLLAVCEALTKLVAKLTRHAIDQDNIRYFETVKNITNQSINRICATKVQHSIYGELIAMLDFEK